MGARAEAFRVTVVVFRQMLVVDGVIVNCGKGFTVIEAEVLAVQALTAVTVREYKPLWLGCTLFRLLFCAREIKLFGPFQTKAA